MPCVESLTVVNDSIPTQLAFKDSNLNRLIQSQPCYLITPKAIRGIAGQGSDRVHPYFEDGFLVFLRWLSL